MKPRPYSLRVHAARALFALLVAGAAAALPAAPLTDAQKIDALIRAVEARSDLRFVRLDAPHSASEAAQMLRVKLAYAGSRVRTVDDFIDGIATATLSGKPYYVRYPDGHQVTSAEFLRAELRRIDAPAAANSR